MEFVQDFTNRTPVVVMTVRAQITRVSTNQVIATKQFSVTQPMPQVSPYAGVYAANYASAHILKRLAGIFFFFFFVFHHPESVSRSPSS